MSDFDNKVVLVTGGSSGIGAAAALMFAARGARLALVGRNAPNLRAVADACARGRSNTPVVIVADLATDEGCERVAKEVNERFERLIALELGPKGVRVNTVSPGVTVTDFVKRLTGYGNEEYKGWLQTAENLIPMGRVCSPEDIAKTIVFLASDEAQLVTGATVQVDGGMNLGTAGSNLISQQVKQQ